MTFEQVEDYINHIQKFAKKNTLDHTREFLNRLGNPQKDIKIVHVAGTNGKGSTCNYLRALLCAKGYRVGMFTSPHLVCICERIMIDDTIISREAFVSCFEAVKQVVDQSNLSHPTFFEFLFLMAMVYYGWEKPDYLILETGLGGRLDATNVFSEPVLTIITEIGLDHQQYLGQTKELIAGEKAGIIKKQVPVVYANRNHFVSSVLERKALEMQAKTYPVDESCMIHKNIRNKGIDFSYISLYYNYIDISLPTYACYQVENASLALRAFELLMHMENQISFVSKEFIQRVLKQTSWSGRMEQVTDCIILDGAHNEDGIDAFLETVPQIEVKGKRILLFSVVDDKAYQNMIKRLVQSDLFTVYIVANIQDVRGLSDASMQNLFAQNISIKGSEDEKTETGNGNRHPKIYSYESVNEAFAQAKEICRKEDMVFCVGSLYLIGEVKSLLDS